MLYHISLFVPDAETSTHFYTKGLSLTVQEDFADIIGWRNGYESNPIRRGEHVS